MHPSESGKVRVSRDISCYHQLSLRNCNRGGQIQFKNLIGLDNIPGWVPSGTMWVSRSRLACYASLHTLLLNILSSYLSCPSLQTPNHESRVYTITEILPRDRSLIKRIRTQPIENKVQSQSP
jgi:hypothetical protein